MIRAGRRYGLGTALVALGGVGFLFSAAAQAEERVAAAPPGCQGESCFEVQVRPTTTTSTSPPTTTAPPTTVHTPSEAPPSNPEVCIPPAIPGPPSGSGGAPTCAMPSPSVGKSEGQGETLTNEEPSAPPAAPEQPTSLPRTGPGNRSLVLASGAALMIGGLGVVFGESRRRRTPS